MPSRTGPTLDSRAPGLGHERLHRKRRARGPLLVQLAVEEEQQGVAAELEHVAAVAPADLDQPGVAPADQRDQLLGAELAPLGEALRERGEARDVEAEQRCVEHAASSSGPTLPRRGEARNERPQRRSGRGRHAHVSRSTHPERVRQFAREIERGAARPLAARRSASAWRTFSFTDGIASVTRRKARSVRMSRWHGEVDVTVAVRGPPVRSAISPKKSPPPSVLIRLPPRAARRPHRSTITTNSRPLWPSTVRARARPARRARPLRRRSPPARFFEQCAKSGTDLQQLHLRVAAQRHRAIVVDRVASNCDAPGASSTVRPR